MPISLLEIFSWPPSIFPSPSSGDFVNGYVTTFAFVVLHSCLNSFNLPIILYKCKRVPWCYTARACIWSVLAAVCSHTIHIHSDISCYILTHLKSWISIIYDILRHWGSSFELEVSKFFFSISTWSMSYVLWLLILLSTFFNWIQLRC